MCATSSGLIDKYTLFNTEADYSPEDREEMEYEVDQAVQDVEAWKAHLLRSINQDSAKQDVLKKLDDKSVLLVSDWAMKFVPRKYRESQRDWFGKRGISWHLSVAIKNSLEKGIEMLTFAHIFESCTQDSPTVLAIFDDVLHQLKSVLPNLQLIYMKQDNAGCYHSAPTMLGIHQIAKNNDVKLARIDFSDPQGGKGSCDRKAATIKNHMRAFLHSGNDIETAQDMKKAIESNGGVAGVAVTLCGKQTNSNFKTTKWDGVSYINNIEYNDQGMKIWKAYGIGTGKSLDWKDVTLPTCIPKLNKKSNDSENTPSFIPVKARLTSRSKNKPTSSTHASSINRSDLENEVSDDTDDDNDDKIEDDDGDSSLFCCPGDTDDDIDDMIEDDDGDSSLFCCPEEGCLKSYQRYSSLEKHLDFGNHKYQLEHQTLYDKAMVMYASKLEEGASEAIYFEHSSLSSCDQQEVDKPSVLPMGWALKPAGKKKRFTENQKRYLVDTFKNGELTGQKANPRDVSKSMRKARNLDGSRMFKKDEFLSSQQISNFFSRLAKAKNLDTIEEEESTEASDLSVENNISELSAEVMEVVGLKHPIMYDTYNICIMASENKLKKFSVGMLTDICNSLELDTSQIKKRLKDPYIKLIQEVVRDCSCTS